MATPPSDETRLLFKLLADGEWHSYQKVRDQIAASVPPGRALRKYQERVESARLHKQDPSYDTSATEDERIFYGARACAQIAITSWKGRGLQYGGEGGNKLIRMQTGLRPWGVPSGPASGTHTAGAVEDSEPAERLRQGPDEGVPPWLASAPGHYDEEPAREVVWVLPATFSDARRAQLEQLFYGDPQALDALAVSPPVAEVAASEPLPGPGTQGDDETHPLPQDRTEGDAEQPLLGESEIRHLVEGAIVTALDRFQAGLQGYLDQQFAQLEAQIQACLGLVSARSKTFSDS